MRPSDYLDLSADPPCRLPEGIPAAVEYLSASLGRPVYRTWSPASLLERYGSMRDAKIAEPQIFALLLAGGTATQFWDMGQTRTLPSQQAPRAEVVVERLLRVLRVRFRPAHLSVESHHGRKAAGAAALRPDMRPAAPVVDAEPWLAGSGRYYNRNPSANSLGALDDGDAVRRFLQERASHSTHTHRAYTEEIRRLIRWCKANGVPGPLSDLTRETLIEYRQWLAGSSPQSPEAGRGQGRGQGEASQRRAMAVLRSVFGFLSLTGYLSANACARLGDTAAARGAFRPERILPEAAVQAVDRWLLERISDTGQRIDVARRAAIVAIYRYCGVRLNELATHDSYPRLTVEASGWTLTVLGKRQKKRSIPLPDICTRFLRQYRLACGLTATPASGETNPLIQGKRGSLGASGLYREVKAAFLEIASTMPASDAAARLVLESASPHWLRHALGKRLVIDKKVPLPMAQLILGHESVVTTAGYSRTNVSELREIMQSSFTLQSSDAPPQTDPSLTR